MFFCSGTARGLEHHLAPSKDQKILKTDSGRLHSGGLDGGFPAVDIALRSAFKSSARLVS